MVGYSTFYLLAMWTRGSQNPRAKMFYAAIFCVNIWYYVTIEMGRRTVFCFSIVIFYYFLFHANIRHKVHALLVVILLSALLWTFGDTKFMGSLYSSVRSTKEEYKASYRNNVTVRIDCVRYYMNEFRRSGYFGLGLSSSKLTESAPLSLGRRTYRYNPNDHGIFAVVYQFGVPAIVLMLIILFFCFRDLAIILRFGSEKFQAIAMGIHLYLVLSIVGLLQVFLKPRMSLWTGLVFFMVWRMREAITCNTLVLRKKQGPSATPARKVGTH